MNKPKIGIIGGGASAALALVHLHARGLDQACAITVFERGDHFPRGVAYSTTEPEHRLNVRAANMSAYPEQPDHFAQWLAARGAAYGPDHFAPRHLFGDYLCDLVAKADFTVRAEDVLSCAADDTGYRVETTSGAMRFDYALQATGNVRPLGPVVEDGVVNYASDPWDSGFFENIAPGAHVVLVGSGLSAVDAISSLVARRFNGMITVVSRNGWFPASHTTPARHADFLASEKMPLSPSQAMRRVRAEIRNAEAAGSPWQAVIDALRGHTNPLWQGWSMRERDIFTRRAMTAWNIHRHRMAPQAAAIIGDLKGRGRLRVLKDRVERIAAPCRVICRTATIEADGVVNCMGYRYDDGRTFDASHRIGPARFGELFETTAIPEIRAQAAEVAAAMRAAIT